MSLPPEIAALFLSVELCGSRVTCRPPPTGTDIDYLCIASIDFQEKTDLVAKLFDLGFKWEGSSEHYQAVLDSDFMSWRKGELNLIVPSNQDFAKRHRAATSVCRRLNLRTKKDRIAVFQAVLYANPTDGEN